MWYVEAERSVTMGKRGRPKSDVTKERIVTIRMSDAEYHIIFSVI